MGQKLKKVTGFSFVPSHENINFGNILVEADLTVTPPLPDNTLGCSRSVRGDLCMSLEGWIVRILVQLSKYI